MASPRVANRVARRRSRASDGAFGLERSMEGSAPGDAASLVPGGTRDDDDEEDATGSKPNRARGSSTRTPRRKSPCRGRRCALALVLGVQQTRLRLVRCVPRLGCFLVLGHFIRHERERRPGKVRRMQTRA